MKQGVESGVVRRGGVPVLNIDQPGRERQANAGNRDERIKEKGQRGIPLAFDLLPRVMP
jgi:hypothetical protein